jgi:ADP-ribose pyrophosphatase YjhB (NUDIX family)
MEQTYRNPLVTVDIIIEIDGGIVLVERRNPPHGWALPGGFVDYGQIINDYFQYREGTQKREIFRYHAIRNP